MAIYVLPNITEAERRIPDHGNTIAFVQGISHGLSYATVASKDHGLEQLSRLTLRMDHRSMMVRVAIDDTEFDLPVEILERAIESVKRTDIPAT